jgi:CHAT domain-containing protein
MKHFFHYRLFHYRHSFHYRHFLIATLTAIATLLCSPLLPIGSLQTPIAQSSTATAQEVYRASDQTIGKQRYDAGQFTAAAQAWEQLKEQYLEQNDIYHLALLQNYLAIVYQDLGEWQKAEVAIAQAQDLLPSLNQPFLQAQLLNTQGSLQLNTGNPQLALETWTASEAIYRSLSDTTGITLSQINQAQALQTLGFYPRARSRLETTQQELSALPDSLLKAQNLRSLGVTLRGLGDLSRSQAVLEESLAIARRLDGAIEMGETLFQLGNTARATDGIAALAFYRQVTTASPRTQIEAALNQLSLLIETGQSSTALISQIQAALSQQAPSRWSVDAQVNLAVNLSRIASPLEIAPQLAQAMQQAKLLQDPRAESYATGELGHLYEQTQQWSEALNLTEKALTLAETIQADDIAVNWQWQRGRILKAQGRSPAAITAYDAALHLLTSLRQDLAVNPEVQYSFRDRVEPIHRQLVQLLLQGVDQLPVAEQQTRLQKSRQTIEALQLAELQNFFREACQTYEAVEAIDPQAAVIYPIVLEQRLEVILSLPGQPLQHYGNALSAAEATDLVNQLRQSLNPAFPASEGLPAAQRLYDWLVRPAEAALTQQQITTLVFVPDDFLRNVPMAVLHDGQNYLIEKYSLALTPGLQLFQSSTLPRSFRPLLGGISQARQGFAALPGVVQEITTIAQQFSSRVLLDQSFTRPKLQTHLDRHPYPVVHLATHGQFSSRAADTFILTWNDRLQIQDLAQWLHGQPIELLVLSACQTAKGDDQAALGLAGLAVRSGARSTIATLWTAQDQSTAELMGAFYRQLQQANSKAESLRHAQLKLLRGKYAHPYYWSSFVLVGNWR